MTIRWPVGTAVVVLFAVQASGIQAQSWEGSATLYGWLPAISGAQEGPDGEPIVNITGPDVLDALDFAFMGAAEIRRERLGFMLDVVYADLDFDGEARRVNVSGDLGIKLYFASGAVSWRVHEGRGSALDFYGGLRATGTDVNFGLEIGALSAEREVSVDWVDPIVGLRGIYPLSERFSMSGRADVGGCGVGSELTWQVYGGLNYAFADRIQGTLGYRYMSIDYEANRLTLDIDLQGPLVGLTFSF
jgi:opacity protein-like surface antigen